MPATAAFAAPVHICGWHSRLRHKAGYPGGKGGIPCVIRTGAVHRRRDVPAVRPDNSPGPTWLGTSMLVTRPHAAAETRAASGSSLLGRIRTGRMRDVPAGTKPFFYPPEDNNGYSQMV